MILSECMCNIGWNVTGSVIKTQTFTNKLYAIWPRSSWISSFLSLLIFFQTFFTFLTELRKYSRTKLPLLSLCTIPHTLTSSYIILFNHASVCEFVPVYICVRLCWNRTTRTPWHSHHQTVTFRQRIFFWRIYSNICHWHIFPKSAHCPSKLGI